MKPQNKPWKEAMEDLFETTLTKQPFEDDEVAWISLGMIFYEAIRNSYPHIEAQEVAVEAAQNVAINRGICTLLLQGRIERTLRADGKYVYRRTDSECLSG